MDQQATIASQYRAALKMLRAAIDTCPDELWTDPGFSNPFWHIAYHALFYTHLYLQESGETYVPWTKHRAEYEFLGPVPWPPHHEPNIGEPYAKQEVLEFFDLCQNELEVRVSSLDMEAESGFDWLPFGKLELQFYNIRHLQHHTGQLSERLRNATDAGIGWVAQQSQSSE